jgi:hypothetical protein
MSKKENKKVDFYEVPKNEWQMPIEKNYKMACCDCGLVHAMDFKVIDPDTNKVIKNARAILRARRHETLTKQLRKNKY